MPATYEPIATTTLGSAASSIEFTSIPATYTDLRIVMVYSGATTNVYVATQFNSDTATNYSWTYMRGNGSAASSTRGTSTSYIEVCRGNIDNTTIGFGTIDIFLYAGSTNKTVLASEQTDKNGAGNVGRTVGLWRSTSAITSIKLYDYIGSNNFATGTTATLYGILKA